MTTKNGLTPLFALSDIVKYVAVPGLFGYSLVFFGATPVAYVLGTLICFAYWVCMRFVFSDD